MFTFILRQLFLVKSEFSLVTVLALIMHVGTTFASTPLDATVKQINADLQYLQVEAFDFPASLASELGAIKTTAFVAMPINASTKKLPLLISLHGGGGKNWTVAEQLARSAKVKGLALAEKANRELVLFAPNSSDNWDPVTLNLALDYFLKQHPHVDTKRMYLIGHSMGGTGTLAWALANPERFAAISPSGFRLRSKLEDIDRLLELPIWLMVGAEDGMRPSDVYGFATDLKKAGHKQVGYTAFPGANHPQANAAFFGSVDLVEWLLSHSKK
ncbi:alpha/beta hydrolase-fold protein [Glaciecola sp. SC05]|uniref:carboxylesterase family protein n=1 Tax=Glaciecola sp. SC05 TaxID=1987355 RepID=UPI0035290404